jgi:hypothetical protein
MSIGQIRQFLAESRGRQKKWRLIHVIGGEPTLHPQFLEIIDLLLDYRRSYSPDARIVVCTNGHGEYVQRMLSLLPPEIVVLNTAKESQVQPDFLTFNVAPMDSEAFADADYTNGCSIIKKCGFGMSPYGYYPCGLAGGIDRVFGFNLGRKSLPADNDNMHDELRKFCAVCGVFKRTPERQPLLGPVMSPTWSKAYGRWAAKRPVLDRYPEQS